MLRVHMLDIGARLGVRREEEGVTERGVRFLILKGTSRKMGKLGNKWCAQRIKHNTWGVWCGGAGWGSDTPSRRGFGGV